MLGGTSARWQAVPGRDLEMQNTAREAGISLCRSSSEGAALTASKPKAILSSQWCVFSVTSERQEMRGVNPRLSEDKQGCSFCLCLSLFLFFCSLLSWRHFFTRNHV